MSQTILPLHWPEALMCPSWVLVEGRRVQCDRQRHGPADGSTCLHWHHADLPRGDREAWTDEDEGTEVRGADIARRTVRAR